MNKPDEKILAALNVRIAELCGWKKLGACERLMLPPLTPKKFGRGKQPPRYTSSLDAIHDAVLALITEDARDTFGDHLREIVRGRPVWMAEAYELSIALDRTLSPEPIL